MTRKSVSRRKRDRNKLPSSRSVAFRRLDHSKSLEILFKDDMLLNQLQRDGPKIARSFDKALKKPLQEASRLLSMTMGILSKHLFAPDDRSSRATTARLVANAVNSYIASVEVARHGYPLQHGTMSRSIVEALATVIVIVTNPAALGEFHDGQLSSSKCVGQAKKTLPLIGPLWGMLSNEFVHIGLLHANLEFPKRFSPKDERLEFVADSIVLNAWLLYVVTELIYHDEVWCIYWKKVGHGVIFEPTLEGQDWLDRFTSELEAHR